MTKLLLLLLLLMPFFTRAQLYPKAHPYFGESKKDFTTKNIDTTVYKFSYSIKGYTNHFDKNKSYEDNKRDAWEDKSKDMTPIYDSSKYSYLSRYKQFIYFFTNDSLCAVYVEAPYDTINVYLKDGLKYLVNAINTSKGYQYPFTSAVDQNNPGFYEMELISPYCGTSLEKQTIKYPNH